ncbi:MAG: hypothetical protein E7360_03165 [Clostridiales bacterium]|nr:hypothetical protein [Clostridiales bacterium]
MKQILIDENFENGFWLYHTDGLITKEPIKTLDFNKTAKCSPSWKLAQWCSRYNLANGQEKVWDDGSFEYLDEAKSVRFWKGKGKARLSLTASKEYTHARREGEGWPHILIEQEFEENHFLCKIEEVVQSIDFTLTEFANMMDEKEQNDLHTVQLQWFIAIQNRNKNSKGYGDFFWFGLPFWDYPRYDFPPAFTAQDGGKEENTGKFINIVNSREFLQKPIRLGENAVLEIPVYKWIKQGFELAKQRNFLQDSNWEDMCLGNMNFGFEVTGTFDVSVLINNIKIFIKKGENDEKDD